MRVRLAVTPMPCDNIVAEFVFGPMRCSNLARFIANVDGEDFYVCKDCIAEQRKAENRAYEAGLI